MTTMAADAKRTRAAQLRAVGRLGARTVRAGGWRNVLIVVLIALGIAVAATVAIGARSGDDGDTFLTERFGAVADVRIDGFIEPQVAFDELPVELQDYYLTVRGAPPAPLAPADPRTVPEIVQDQLGDVPLVALSDTFDPASGTRILAVDLAHPLAQGLIRTDAAPPGPGEVLLSRAALRELDVRVGDEVAIQGAGVLTVTGQARGSNRINDRLAVVGPDGATPTSWLVAAGGEPEARRLAAALSDRGDDQALRPRLETRLADIRYDYRAIAGSLARQVVTEPSFIGSMVGALILLQVGLVAAAAFATGTRRRIREFGLLGTTGAAPHQIRQLVLVEALVLGVGAALLGTALGVIVSYAGRPLLELVQGRYIDAIRVHPLDLLGPATVGVGAALLAALWPAITVARTSTATALAGRIPLRAVPRWLPVLSVVTTAVGLLVLALTVGSVGPDLGRDVLLALAVIATALGAASLGVPLIGGVGRLADRLPIRLRLAVRDTVRQRTRSGATVAALVVVMMVPTVAMTSVATDLARFGQSGSTVPSVRAIGPEFDGIPLPVTDRMVEEALSLLPVTATDRVDVLLLDGLDYATDAFHQYRVEVLDSVRGNARHAPGLGTLTLATDELVDALALDGDTRRFLADGGIVDLALPGTLNDAQRRVGVRRAQVVGLDAGSSQVTPVELLSVEPPIALLTSGSLVSAETAQALGLPEPRRTVAALLPRFLTEAELTAYYSRPYTAEATQLDIAFTGTLDQVPLLLIAGGVALLVAMAIIAMATALAATESDRDLSVITAVGADPRIRPIVHGIQATYHAGLAALIAVPIGLLLYRVALRDPYSGGVGIVVPWLGLAGIAIGIPVTVGVIMRLAVRPARAVVQRRIA
ncbi:hypothetical protein BH23ACT9_BH23ACT9_07440 [soil metagenome]